MLLKILLIIAAAIAAAAVLVVCAVLLFLFRSPVVGRAPDKARRAVYAQKTPFYRGGRFRNENDVSIGGPAASDRSAHTVPDRMIPTEKLNCSGRGQPGELSVTWLGHSSSLVRLGGRNILIDPVLSAHASPVGFAGPRRFSEPPVRAEDIRDIDVVFISHDHYDHLDYGTIRTIDKHVGIYIVPLGVDVILSGWGVDPGRIRALAWWESATLDGSQYTLTPGQHFTGRNPLRPNAALWGGLYMSDGAHSVYYTGDGGYYDVFTRVHERLGAPDLMLGECGQYDLRWAQIHMFPEHTVQAARDAGARWLIPVHWGAYCICNTAWYDSPERALAEAERTGQHIAVPAIGQTVDYDSIGSFSERWWEKYK